MGLDMYLYAADDKFIDAVKKDVASNYTTSEVDNYYHTHGSTDHIYWRKANSVHRFFCEYAECIDSQVYYIVSRDLIEKLCEKCRDVLVEHEKADIKLPTQCGFFFGSLDYDEYYFSKIVYTLENLAVFLERYKDHTEFLYYASW